MLHQPKQKNFVSSLDCVPVVVVVRVAAAVGAEVPPVPPVADVEVAAAAKFGSHGPDCRR